MGLLLKRWSPHVISSSVHWSPSLSSSPYIIHIGNPLTCSRDGDCSGNFHEYEMSSLLTGLFQTHTNSSVQYEWKLILKKIYTVQNLHTRAQGLNARDQQTAQSSSKFLFLVDRGLCCFWSFCGYCSFWKFGLQVMGNKMERQDDRQ